MEVSMSVILGDLPTRYIEVDGVVVWDHRQLDGSRFYMRYVGGRWEPYPLEHVMRIINLGNPIDGETARSMIMAANVARTGCAFNDDFEELPS